MDDHLHLTVDYEPSRSTKKLWLSTRKDKNKKEYSYEGFSQKLSLFGLFDTQGYRLDRFLFYLAIIFEIAGMVIITALAGGGYLILGTLATAIVIDIFLAIGVHLKKGEICEYENKKVVAKFNNDPDRTEACQERINYLEKWWLARVCLVLIWLFSITKSFFFYTINGGDIFAILMLLLYIFIAYVHTNHTGYFIAHARLKGEMRREQKQHLAALLKNDTTPNSVTTHRIKPLNTTVTFTESHKCKNEKGNHTTAPQHEERENAIYKDKTDNDWKLKTWGVLTDEELNHIVTEQPDAVKGPFVVKGLEEQLEMLTSNAKR
ncbi:MAG: hypothetical protein EPO28_07595 [Saprospiraceae bacterium]|nr:MAG: hypothetical protein EPO28_07595 [Saprospiraceae bacterium]